MTRGRISDDSESDLSADDQAYQSDEHDFLSPGQAQTLDKHVPTLKRPLLGTLWSLETAADGSAVA